MTSAVAEETTADPAQSRAEYTSVPFQLAIERADVISRIMRSMCGFETIFTDYHRACAEKCFQCDACFRAMSAISSVLSHPQSRVWEVWRTDRDEAEIVGIVLLTDIVPGRDAVAHYAFFDGRLKDKTPILLDVLHWCFEDHPDWPALRRLTVEVPDFAFALARHAQKYLGFTGDFAYTRNNSTLKIEGVRKGAMLWRGVDRDMLILGRRNV